MPDMKFHPPLDIQAFSKICARQTQLQDYPLAQSVQKNIVCYSGDKLHQAVQDAETRLRLLQEMQRVLQSGPGVILIKAAFPDKHILETQNQVFEQILQQEADLQTGDHFAKVGANSRIWNVLQKTALLNPQSFIDYYQNPLLALVSEAWLGPNYQMTAQVNIVHPGGQAQSPHRDYHLGFQSPEVLAAYPPHVHGMSTLLTLQAGVAHTDMPLEAGPTLFLPYSQQYAQGYLAWRETAFIEYFQEHAVQLPLQQGDAVFFNPALFHAAGTNSTDDFHRIGNLLQVSSAFGRAMETVDRYAISEAIYPLLLEQWSDLSAVGRDALLSCASEGYAFPTNLDTDPPLAGMAPETHRQLLERGLADRWIFAAFRDELVKHRAKRQA